MQVFGLPRQVIKNGRALTARCQRRTERRPRRASGRRPTGDSLSLEKDVTPKSRRPRRLRPKTLDAGAPPGGRQGRRQLPRQDHRRHALPGEGHPGRRRKRVHGRVRGRLPRQGPRSLRSAAPQAANERRRRTLQRRMAIRVLRNLRPALLRRRAQPHPRQLPAPLQPPPTPRRSCRKDPGPVSRQPLSDATPAVSYVLILYGLLRRDAAFARKAPHELNRHGAARAFRWGIVQR